MTSDLNEYFDKLYLRGIHLSDGQKAWYKAKQQMLREDMTREYPSYPEEAFAASQDGYWYAREMKNLHETNHIANISYDRALPVHTSWDLGQADKMCIWFFQINRAEEINLIDYFGKNNTDLASCLSILNSKGYTYDTHLWPFDANARDRAGITFVMQAAEMNLHGIVLENHDLKDGIRLVRTTLSKCWFDQTKCKEGIQALENYKKRWSPQLGGWTSEPVHDDASHGADSFRYLCAGLKKIRGTSADLTNDAKALRSYWGG
jgi:hypothetical protein